ARLEHRQRHHAALGCGKEYLGRDQQVRRRTAQMNDFNDFAHTGPGTLAGRYLRKFWQPVYHLKDLPAGRAVPIRVMSENFTLYRGEDGTVHTTAFRCP